MKRYLPIQMICILAFLLLNESACKKPGQTITVPVDAEMLKYFGYKEGSYWIYRDSVTGVEDSFFIHSIVTGGSTTQVNQGEIEDYMYIHLYGFNKNNNDTILWTLGYYGNYTNMNIGYFSYLYGYQLFAYPFTYTYPNYLLNGVNYTNILAAHTWGAAGSSSFGNLFCDDWYYINQDSGIVKVRLNHICDSVHYVVWELQREKIIR